MARVSRGRKEAAAGIAAATDATAPLPAVGPEVAVSGPADVPEQREASIVDRSDPAPPSADSLQGYIDEANGARITGWIWNRRQPEERLEVELIDGNTRLARVVANQYRSDLLQAGIGDGRHAFAIPLGEALLPYARHVLQLRCAGSGAELPGSPVVIERALAAPQPLYEAAMPYLPPAAGEAAVVDDVDAFPDDASVAEHSGSVPPGGADAKIRLPRPVGETPQMPGAVVEPALQSNIDFADWTGIRGWIWNPQEPEKRIALDLLDGDTRLATVLATEYREDLEAAGIGDGRHGFSVPFTATLLPYARHVLHLRPVGSAAEVPSFPLVLTREQAGLDATVQFILGNVMAEAERAESTEDLAPVIGALVTFLDAALARHFLITEEGAASTAELLSPAQLSPQVRTLVDSMRWNYPPIAADVSPQPTVSIVIPVFNKFELTYNCVKSIVETGSRIPFEIIVVDDYSRDETLLASFAFGAGIRLVRNFANRGFIRSCNRGFEMARGEYAVFLNNDTEVKARWLDELYETMQREPSVGVVGSKLLFPNGTLQECGGVVWRLGDAWNWGRDQPADDPRFCYMRDVDYVSGAALMIKSALFKELGGFDEYYLPMYYEDTDLCFRARQLGYRVVVQPTSEVVHFEGASGGTSTTGSGMKRFQAINHRKFFERWRDALAGHRFNGELPELEAERQVRQRALFIDDSVPEPDKDAGSNAALQHMLSLQRLGYKVTFIPGDNMARIDPYTADLQRRGIECLYHPFYFSVEDVFRKTPVPFELVYLHRYSNASKYAGMIRQHFPKARILYNVADLHFLRLQRQAEVQDDATLRDKADQLRRLEIGAMSFVDCVIVHSDAEAEMLRQIAPEIEVRVIPWTVALREVGTSSGERLGDGAETAATSAPAIAFIGGYRHPPNVDAAVWAAQSIMPVLRQEVPGIELLLVGSHMPAEVSALAAKDIVPLGYVPSLDGVFERVRLTIAPLRYGAGLKGKVLESMAAGIPCVMTTVAAEGLGLPAALQSLVADDPQGLSQRIATLCRDDAEYRRAIEGCKAHIAARYSPARIDSLIREACRLD